MYLPGITLPGIPEWYTSVYWYYNQVYQQGILAWYTRYTWYIQYPVYTDSTVSTRVT